MNWTSTTVPLWQIDCEAFRKVGGAFQLRNLKTDEHRMFVKRFCALHGLGVTMDGTTATFGDVFSGTAKR